MFNPSPDITTMQNIDTRTKRFGRMWRVDIITVKKLPEDMQGFDPVRSPDADLVQETVVSFGSMSYNNPWEPEQLQVQFEVEMVMMEAPWWGKVVIYNVNRPTQQDMIRYGMSLRLFAGYRSDQQVAKIYEGYIYYPMWERDGGANWKLTLLCMSALFKNVDNFAMFNTPANTRVREMVAQMAAQARYPFKVIADEKEYDKETDPETRAAVFFGQPKNMLSYAASTVNKLTWFEDEAAHIASALPKNKPSPTVAEIEYNETCGMIGSPQMIDNGIGLRVLLDSRVHVSDQIKVSPNVLINQTEYKPTPEMYPTFLDQNGEYIVQKVRHIGDSRGNDWYTDITAIVQPYAILLEGQI